MIDRSLFSKGKGDLLMRKFAIVFFICLMAFGAVARAEPAARLAARLPADTTLVYADLDTSALLKIAPEGMRLVDADKAEKITYQVGEIYAVLRQLAANYEFQPELFDEVESLRLHLVLMQKETPAVQTYTQKFPKFDPDSGKLMEGEFEEHTFKTVSYSTASLVIETPAEDVAEDFLTQVKGLFEFLKEAKPEEYKDVQRKDIDVENGELIAFSPEPLTIGRFGRFIIVSSDNPKRLWGALLSSPAKSVADLPLYQKLVGQGAPAQFVGIVNLSGLIHQLGERLESNLEEAKKKAAEVSDPSSPFSGGQFELMIAQSFYNAFQRASSILSLDKLRCAGVAGGAQVKDGVILSASQALLSHDEPISAVLEELLSGSGSLSPPETGKADNVAIMARLDPKTVYDNVLKDITGPSAATFTMAMQQMKAQLGADLADIVGALGSDLYVFMDFARKEMEQTKYVGFNEKTGEFETETTMVQAVLPEVSLLWGVRDAHKAQDTLAAIFTQLSANQSAQGAGDVMKKRTYQDEDVYCFGQRVTEPESYPDGTTSYALAVVGRYLAAGSWDHVTGMIRRMKAGQLKSDARLMAIVEQHPDANLIVVQPRAFQEKMEELVAEGQEEGSNAYAKIIEKIEEEGLGLEDKELEGRLRTAVVELVKTFEEISKAAQAGVPELSVITGAHKGEFYEISTQTEWKKP